MIPKFRIFDKQKKQMVESAWWEFYFEDERLLTVTSDLDVSYYDDELGERWELIQSTGLHDKNGKEIFEGDILNHPLQGMRKVYYPFTDRVASYGLENIENGMRNTLQDAHRLYEVIGNIHEHSHLLDVEGLENESI